MNLTVTFEIGTDVDMATVLVQNRVAIADPKLPEETKRQGVTTQKTVDQHGADGELVCRRPTSTTRSTSATTST